MFATEYIWHDIKNEKTVGILDENEMEGYVEVAEPVGVICGVTPTTNPTSTTLFKCLIAVKTRNPIIFGFHPSAQKCSAEAARIVYEAAVKAGAPENCIQWIDKPSIEATGALMNHPGAVSYTHLAQLARTMGIPAVVMAGEDFLETCDGRLAALDGNGGEAYLDPDEGTKARFSHSIRLSRRRSITKEKLREAMCVTRDGTRITLMASCATPSGVVQALSLIHI